MPHPGPVELRSTQRRPPDPLLSPSHEQWHHYHHHRQQQQQQYLQDCGLNIAAACSSSSCTDTLTSGRRTPYQQRIPIARYAMVSCRCDAHHMEPRPSCGHGGCFSNPQPPDGRVGASMAVQFFPLPRRFPAPQLLLLTLLLLAPPPRFMGLWEESRCQPHSPGSKTILHRHVSHGPIISVLMQIRSCGRNPVQLCTSSAAKREASSPAPERRWRRRRMGLVLAAAVSPPGSGGQGGGAAAGAAALAGSTISTSLPGVDKGSLLMRPSFDASLDWASNVTAKGVGGCTLAKDAASPAFMPRRCPKPRRPVGIEEARKLGWKFAPLLHQHSLDWSRLSDPGAWLASAVLVDPVTYTTTDLKTYLGNRHRAQRAKTEKAAAEAAAAAATAAAAASGGSDAQARDSEAAAAKATAAAAEAAAADPYWRIHEAYDTHNFFATRLVRRRYVSAPPQGPAAASPGPAGPHGRETQQHEQQPPQPELAEARSMSDSDHPSGLRHPGGQQRPHPPPQQQQRREPQAGAGRRMMEGAGSGARSQQDQQQHHQHHQQRRRQHQEVEMEVEVEMEELGFEGGEVAPGAGGGGEGGGSSTAAGGRQEEQEGPYWPRFEVLQGEEFFEAIAGDPLVWEGEEEDGGKDGAGESRGAGGGKGPDGPAGRPGWRRQRRAATEGRGNYSSAAAGGGGGGGGGKQPARLGGKVYFTVFEPRLEHLHWTRPRPRSHTASSPADDPGPFTAGWEAASEEPTYAYVYTFWFFYPFNGCSNQLMATRFAGRHQAAEYFLCPLGVHEGDWEHLKVYVCQDGMLDEHEPARAITALQYSQHTWLPTYDCANGSWPGDCSFEPDPDTGQLRPRVYSGLHSHANSPHTSNLNVYAKVNFKQLLNFDGIYVADRFAAGGPLFVPSAANTRWLPFPQEMGKEGEGVPPEDFRPGGALAWTAYLGNWGVPLTSPNFSITCLTHNLSLAGPCDPRNPPVFILDRLLGGVGARPLDVTWTPVLSPKRVAPELAEPISGPLVRRAAAYSWERELPAPLWDAREPLPGLGGLSLATLARDTSSLACPLAEDVHRTSAWGPAGHYLGNDPRVAHRLRLFVAAATAAIVAAAALSALVVKCMPLILAPHQRPPHHQHHHHGCADQRYGGYGDGRYWHEQYEGSRGTVVEPYAESYRAVASQVGSPPLLGLPHTFRLVYGGHDNDVYEPLMHREDSLHDVSTSGPYRRQQQQRGGTAAPAHHQWDGRRAAAAGGGGGGGGSGSGRSASESYSSFNSSATVSGDEGAAAAPPLQGPDGRLLSYDSRIRRLSHDGTAAKLLRQGTSTVGPSADPQAAVARFSEDGSGGSGGGAAGTAVPAHRRCSEEQPLLAATASSRSRREGEGADDGADDDDDGDKPRRTAWRGWGSFAFRTAAACPAVKLLPLLAWRGCLAACRCFCGALCYPCRFCLRGKAGADVSGSSSGGGGGPGGGGGSSSSARRRRRRGLGPYLLGCATQPERRLLWLSLGIMAYSLGLIMSVQGLLETLHALRNLLLRGLWAIAGLEGVFVALLAAGGVIELGLMVAAVSLGPKPQALGGQERLSAHARQGAPAATVPPPTAFSTDAAAVETSGGGGGAGDGGLSLTLPSTSSAPPGSLALSMGPPGALQAPLIAAKGSGPANGLPSTAAGAAGSRSVSGGGASDWEVYGIPHPHIHFPSTAAVAATAAAATAAATAAASAAASAAATAAAKVPWRTLALLAAVGYMEVAASLHLLGFGLALWVGVLGASEGCSAAVQGLYRIISFSPDVCLDLSMIGVPGPRCGGDLMQMCNVWRQLRLSGLLYGSLLIIAARLLLLIMATANYHSRHAVLLPLPPHHHHHHHGHHHQYHHHYYQQHHQQHHQSRHPQPNGDGVARGGPGGSGGSGWVELTGGGAGGSAWAGGGGRGGGGGGGGGGNSRHRATQRVQCKSSGPRPPGCPATAADGDGEAEGIGGDALHWQRQQHQQQQQEPRRRTRRQRDGGGGKAMASAAGDEPAAATTGTVIDGDISICGVTSTSRAAAAVAATSSAHRMRGKSLGSSVIAAGDGATGIGGGGAVAGGATAGDAGGGSVGVPGGALPVSAPAGLAGGGAGGGGSMVVLEMGSMGTPARVLSAAGGSAGGGGGAGSSLGSGSGSGKGRRWGLFGF